MNNYNVKGIAVIVNTVLASRLLEDLAAELTVKNIYPSYLPPKGKAVAAFNFFNGDEAIAFAAAIETNEGLLTLDASKGEVSAALAAGVTGAVSGKQAVFAHKCLNFGIEEVNAWEEEVKPNRAKAIATGRMTGEAFDAELAARRKKKIDALFALSASEIIEKFKTSLPRAWA